VNPGRRGYATQGGYYRRRRWYDDLLRELGYRTRLADYSTSLISVGSLARVGISPRLASLSTLGMNSAVRAARILKRDVDYCNWFLERT
jgi:hypothetical protein